MGWIPALPQSPGKMCPAEILSFSDWYEELCREKRRIDKFRHPNHDPIQDVCAGRQESFRVNCLWPEALFRFLLPPVKAKPNRNIEVFPTGEESKKAGSLRYHRLQSHPYYCGRLCGTEIAASFGTKPPSQKTKEKRK